MTDRNVYHIHFSSTNRLCGRERTDRNEWYSDVRPNKIPALLEAEFEAVTDEVTTPSDTDESTETD